MEQISIEKKLALVRSVREENQMNLSKIRNREQILFGHSVTGENPILFVENKNERGLDSRIEAEKVGALSGLKVRMFLAVLLFVGFLLIDGGVIGGKQMSSLLVQNKINESFTINHLTDLLTFDLATNMIKER